MCWATTLNEARQRICFFSFLFLQGINSVTFLFYYPMATPELILLEQEISLNSSAINILHALQNTQPSTVSDGIKKA
jgi:hypothetical protein